jgi:hypothetical protein
MSDIITTIDTSIGLFKRLKELNKKLDNADFSMYIADLGLELANVKMSLTELIYENEKLKEQIKKLEEKDKNGLIFKNNLYYDNENKGPYCPTCYSISGKRTLLIINPNKDFINIQGKYKCPACNHFFSS